MDYKLMLIVSASVFVAELGDKTQLATLLFAADKEANKLTVFAAASLALVLTSAIGVLAGASSRSMSAPGSFTMWQGPVSSPSASGRS